MRRWLAGTAITVGTFLATACGAAPAAVVTTTSTAVDRLAEDHSPADAEFLRAMIPQQNRAVAMASQVRARAASPELRDLATGIDVRDETRIGAMQEMLLAWHEARPLPGAPAPAGTPTDEQMVGLAGMTGPAFDRSFLALMITHHAAGIAVARGEIAGGRDDRTVALAREVVATDQVEIGRMRELLTRV
jgi:uncharacterized protein (DUF305 family)